MSDLKPVRINQPHECFHSDELADTRARAEAQGWELVGAQQERDAAVARAERAEAEVARVRERVERLAVYCDTASAEAYALEPPDAESRSVAKAFDVMAQGVRKALAVKP